MVTWLRGFGSATTTLISTMVALAVWTLPVVMVPFGLAHFPLAPIVLSAFAGRLIWRLARGKAWRPATSEKPIAVLGHLVAQQ